MKIQELIAKENSDNLKVISEFLTKLELAEKEQRPNAFCLLMLILSELDKRALKELQLKSFLSEISEILS